MPEIVTKYPKIIQNELNDIGAKCGKNLPPKILKSCPPQQFCSLPAGEICIYDTTNFKHMTQITRSDWYQLVTGVPSMFSATNIEILLLIFALGMLIGAKFLK